LAIFTKYNSDDQIKEDGMVGAQFTRGRGEMNMKGGQRTIDNSGRMRSREDSRVDIKETG
jgi:hypothetical protein